jgi:hypothetical protein
MNNFETNVAGTPGRDSAERHLEGIRVQGGMFVEAVRVTRMPMMVTDATLPGNPIIFANEAFMTLSGYSITELLGGVDKFEPVSGGGYMNHAHEAFCELVVARGDGAVDL